MSKAYPSRSAIALIVASVRVALATTCILALWLHVTTQPSFFTIHALISSARSRLYPGAALLCSCSSSGRAARMGWTEDAGANAVRKKSGTYGASSRLLLDELSVPSFCPGDQLYKT